MKKILPLFIIIILAVNLIACNNVDLSTTTRVIPPKVALPIEGNWVVNRYAFCSISAMMEEEAKKWIGQKASFERNTVVLPDDSCEQPEFKIKIVNAKEYLYYNYKCQEETLGINQDQIGIITINSNENYFRDIIKFNENSIAIIKDGVFFFLTKESGEVKAENKTNIKDKISTTKSYTDTKKSASGILLGLKHYKIADYKLPCSNGQKQILEPVYRTLWISYDGSISPISELPFLLIPRRTGFWRFDVKREITSTYAIDFLLPAPIGKESLMKDIEPDTIKNKEFYDLKSINFVGNDYVCYERNSESYTKGDVNSFKSDLLEVEPLDTLYAASEIPVNISKVLGEKGIDALNAGAQSYLRNVSDKNKEALQKSPSPTSFGVYRKNGKWVLRGRLNYANQSVGYEHGDFNIPMPAPENFVNYDSLFPSWEVIKQKVPNAIDAYSSPNKDIVVVLTNSKLFVYPIQNNVLGSTPLTEFELKNSEVSVMGQWALDDYVKSWTKEVNKQRSK